MMLQFHWTLEYNLMVGNTEHYNSKPNQKRKHNTTQAHKWLLVHIREMPVRKPFCTSSHESPNVTILVQKRGKKGKERKIS